MRDYDLFTEQKTIIEPLAEMGLLTDSDNPEVKQVCEVLLGVELSTTPGGTLFAPEQLVLYNGRQLCLHLRLSIDWLKNQDATKFALLPSTLRADRRDRFIDYFDIACLYSEHSECCGIGSVSLLTDFLV
jgi:hypothetical protein